MSITVINSIVWENNIRKYHLPDGYVVIYGLSAQHSKIDVNAVSRRNSHAPHTVLEVGVFLWVTRGVNSSI